MEEQYDGQTVNRGRLVGSRLTDQKQRTTDSDEEIVEVNQPYSMLLEKLKQQKLGVYSLESPIWFISSVWVRSEWADSL